MDETKLLAKLARFKGDVAYMVIQELLEVLEEIKILEHDLFSANIIRQEEILETNIGATIKMKMKREFANHIILNGRIKLNQKISEIYKKITDMQIN